MSRLTRSLLPGLLLLSVVCVLALPARGQEKSVVPGINVPYEKPKVEDFVKRFEGEDRDVAKQQKAILEACKLRPGMAVADVGAGTGLFTRLFAAEVGPTGMVYAVDITPKFLEHVEKTCREAKIVNVKTVLCKCDSIELPANSVDLALVCDVYHHLEFPQKTLATIHRALRPGGQLILIEFRRVKGQSPDWIMSHVRAGQEVFTAEVEAAGFKVTNEAKFLKDNYLVRFEKVEPAAKTPAGKP